MRELPSGTVTFLFTDIERSTQSAEALGDEGWAEALQIHRDLLRPAFQKHGGVEVGTEGDSFFVAFARAADAVNAAVEGQRALKDGSGLHIRMGMHTGEALVRDGGYVGHEIHRAKRISDAGHGGQILLSQTTADLVGSSFALIGLGRHRLKDLGEPQVIYQLVDEGLQREFPPVRSLDAFTHSLPLQRSAFIGREKELADIRDLLAANRIVTLTGVGGCGKTRLALQVGAEELDDFPDGVFFVNLAPISDPDLVPSEVATAVGVRTGGAVAGIAPAGPIDELLLSHLGSRTSLVILDNCEHLVDACAEIADLILTSCPDVTILATSREALRVEGEQAWSVPSLSLPAATEDAQSSESVSLFKSRATAVRKGFELAPENLGAVVEICRRLDGIPLAIEFAAARVSHLSPQQIAGRLDDRFRLLTGGQRRVQRQHTLQATLDWSFDLLASDEQILLRRLSVFAGDFAIEAVEGICGDNDLEAERITDLLGSLVSKSLVDADVSLQDVRYRLLESVRAYAAERLTHAGEGERFRVRHRDWYLGWIESHDEEARSSLSLGVRAAREAPNFLAALEWSSGEGRVDIVARLASRLSFLSFAPELVPERWLRQGLEAEANLSADDRVILTGALALRAMYAGAGPGTLAITDDLLEGTSPATRAFALSMRAVGSAYLGAFTRNSDLIAAAYRDLDEAEDLPLGDLSLGLVLFARGHAEMIFGRPRDALPALERSLRSFDSGANAEMAAAMCCYVAATAHVLGEHDRARRAWTQFRGLYVRPDSDLADGTMPDGICTIFATLEASMGSTEDAWTAITWFHSRVLRSGIQRDVDDLILACANVRAIEGDYATAAALLSWVRANALAVGRPLTTGAHYLLYLHYRDKVRLALGAEEARETRERGADMSLEDAIELAFAGKVRA